MNETKAEDKSLYFTKSMFTLVSTTDFPERKMTAKLFRHDCGMQVLSLEADDPENLFVLCLPTDPI
ncbi:MAG: hypothetical protein MJ106_04655, partial [Lentisphaeria bacterium]|nr:hypothetical protein [Lentisphaeria bacterium]